MKVTTETICTDPWKFAATASSGDISHTYVGDEGESRSQVKRIAVKQLEAKLEKLFGSRN